MASVYETTTKQLMGFIAGILFCGMSHTASAVTPQGMQWALGYVDSGSGSWDGLPGTPDRFGGFGFGFDANVSLLDTYLGIDRLIDRVRFGDQIVMRGLWEKSEGIRSTFGGTETVDNHIGFVFGWGLQGAFAVSPDIDIFVSRSKRDYSGFGLIAEEGFVTTVYDWGVRYSRLWASIGTGPRVSTAALRWGSSSSDRFSRGDRFVSARIERISDDYSAELTRVYLGIGFAY